MTNEEQNKLHAYHEAGHAVACFIFNIPITEVSIEEDPEEPGRIKGVTHDTSFGFDEKKYCTDWKTRERFIGLIVVAYAGKYAAKRIDDLARLNKNDLEFAIKYIEKVYPNDDMAALLLRKLSEIMAIGLFHIPKHWDAVKALVKKLLEKPCIPGEEAELIIKNAITEVLY